MVNITLAHFVIDLTGPHDAIFISRSAPCLRSCFLISPLTLCIPSILTMDDGDVVFCYDIFFGADP